MELVEFTCSCGNALTVQSLAVQLGLVTSCGHCYRDFPRETHELALQDSINSLGRERLLQLAERN